MKFDRDDPVVYAPTYSIKVKVSHTYDPYDEECLLGRTLVLGHRLCEVGWPVPILAAFISPVFPFAPIRCWVDSERASNPWLEVCLEPWIFGTVGKCSNRHATRPSSNYMFSFSKHSLCLSDIKFFPDSTNFPVISISLFAYFPNSAMNLLNTYS